MKRALLIFAVAFMSALGATQPRAGVVTAQNIGGPQEGNPPGTPPPPPVGAGDFGISTGQSSVFPSGGPASVPRRPSAGDAWNWLQTSATTFNWGALDGWVNNAISHGVRVVYTFNEVSKYCNGGKAYAVPPTDVDSGNACVIQFATQLMQRYCGTTHPPAAPGSCKIGEFEGWNEFNTGTLGPPVGGFWVGTYLQLAKMDKAAMGVVKTYCPTCKFYAGSTTAGGDGYNPGGGSGQFDVAMKQFLAAWVSLGGPYPDGVTYHPYCCRTDVFPEPWPTSIKSDSSPRCPGTVTSSCRTPLMDQPALLRAAMCDASLGGHFCTLPIMTTEGGSNHNANLADTQNGTFSGGLGNGTIVTLHDPPADWVTGTKAQIAGAGAFNTGAGYVTLTKTGARTFTFPSSGTGTSSSGRATTVTVVSGVMVNTAATWEIRQAWLMQWMLALKVAGTEWNLAYLWDDKCWMTFRGSGAHFTQCVNDPIIPLGNTVLVDSWNRMVGWFAGSTGFGAFTSTAVGSDYIWTVSFTHAGNPAKLVWFSGWRATTTYTMPGGFTTAEDADGNVTTPGATLTIGNRMTLIY